MSEYERGIQYFGFSHNAEFEDARELSFNPNLGFPSAENLLIDAREKRGMKDNFLRQAGNYRFYRREGEDGR